MSDASLFVPVSHLSPVVLGEIEKVQYYASIPPLAQPMAGSQVPGGSILHFEDLLRKLNASGAGCML